MGATAAADDWRYGGYVRVTLSNEIEDALRMDEVFRPVIVVEPPLDGESHLVVLPNAEAGFEGSFDGKEVSAEVAQREVGMATASLPFVGSALNVAGIPGPEASIVHIYVDGELRAMIDLYWPEPYDKVEIYSHEWRRTDTHALRLLMAGTEERLRIGLDAEVVYLPSPPAAQDGLD